MTREPGRGQSLTTYLVLAVSIVVFLIGGYRFLNRPKAEGTTYGSNVERLTLEDTAGRRVVSEPGTWRAFLVASPTDDIALIRALRSAIEERGHDGQPMRATLFAREAADAPIPAVAQSAFAPIEIVPLTKNTEVLSHGLHVPTTDRQLILVNPAGQVAFHGTHPRYTDVRLVLDRYVPLRKARNEEAPLRVGDTLADVSLTTLAGHPAPSSRPDRLWIVFTSRCTACALNTHADIVGSVQKSVARFAAGRKSEAALVFAPSFDNEQVRKKMDSLHMTLPVYVASSEFPAIEGAAETVDSDVLVIERDDADRVTRLEPLPAFLNELTEDGE